MTLHDSCLQVERNLTDAMGVARNICVDPRLVPGGGCCEIAVSRALAEMGAKVEGVEQWPYKAVGVAMEVIPRWVLLQPYLSLSGGTATASHPQVGTVTAISVIIRRYCYSQSSILVIIRWYCYSQSSILVIPNTAILVIPRWDRYCHTCHPPVAPLLPYLSSPGGTATAILVIPPYLSSPGGIAFRPCMSITAAATAAPACRSQIPLQPLLHVDHRYRYSRSCM